MTADDPDNDFECPVCGGSVRAYGNGRRDCLNCPWERRPNREENAEQDNLTNY